MKIFYTSDTLTEYISTQKKKDKKIGFVPTMGALHAGHLSLIARSLQECDLTVCSIYVNPLQFADKQQSHAYPRVINKDLDLLEKKGCDVLFLPQDKILYPIENTIEIKFGEIENSMEGKHRKGHFSGVAVVLTKLFHIIHPDFVYLGQKDYQQFLIMKAMVSQLFFPLQLICCPTVRHASGLAYSSRNLHLSEEDKTKATQIYATLERAKKEYLSKKEISQIEYQAIQYLETYDFKVDYFSFFSAQDLKKITTYSPDKEIWIAFAGSLHEIRLIDNIFILTD